MLQAPPVNRAGSFQEALAAMQRLQRRDGPEILTQARSALLHHGARTPLALVLLHGFTNHPGQFREFAPLAHARGLNVLIPRLPGHGDRDRLTKRLAHLTAPALIERASQALDIACGLGERVCVAGISSSGLLAAYFAQYRADVQHGVVIAPEFAILDFSYALSQATAAAMRVLPNAFLWWDPRVKNGMHPLTAYPRFPTHALAQTLRIAADVRTASKRTSIRAARIDVVMNVNDPAVNNAATAAVVRDWNARKAGCAFAHALGGLPRNHDIIEPDNPKARTDLVYPQLLEIVAR
ncbi:MAG: alpha/beta hydrolase [Candidatus Baltobacteraceae bacterium]